MAKRNKQNKRNKNRHKNITYYPFLPSQQKTKDPGKKNKKNVHRKKIRVAVIGTDEITEFETKLGSTFETRSWQSKTDHP
jgi:hypothetical protein